MNWSGGGGVEFPAVDHHKHFDTIGCRIKFHDRRTLTFLPVREDDLECRRQVPSGVGMPVNVRSKQECVERCRP